MNALRLSDDFILSHSSDGKLNFRRAYLDSASSWLSDFVSRGYALSYLA